MPPALISSLCLWADTQSLISRTSEAEVAFKAPFARKLLQLATQLIKWHRHRCQSVKALALPVEADMDADDENDGQGITETGGEDNSDGGDNVMDEDTDGDVAAEEDIDELGGDDSDLEQDPHPFVPGF